MENIFSKKLGALSLGESIIFFVSILLVFSLLFAYFDTMAQQKRSQRLAANGDGANGSLDETTSSSRYALAS